MAKDKALFLYEEVMLLALRDEQGTIATGFVEHVVAGAILADLLLESRISIDDTKKQLVNLQNDKTSGDPVIDECLEKMAAVKRRASLSTWVQRLAGIKKLKHKVAQQLCERGILRADEDKILFLFNRRIYPEINPMPEKKIIERMREAIITNGDLTGKATGEVIAACQTALIVAAIMPAMISATVHN